MNMNKMLAMGLMLFSSQAPAQSWTEIGGTRERIYFDAQSVDRNSHHPSIWIKRVNDRGSEILTLEKYNCKERTFNIMSAMSAYADGRTTDAITSSSGMQNAVDTDASGFRAAVYKDLCPIGLH